jgi:Tfp pilus assembly protein PilX
MMLRHSYNRAIGRVGDERGIAMIVAIGVLMVLLLLTAVVVAASVNESGIATRDTMEKRAFESAQAGLVQTRYRMNMLINSSSLVPLTLQGKCIGQATVSGQATETLQDPASAYASIDCLPWTESLGNGAFFTSWTSIVLSTGQTCAGSTIGPGSIVTQRCITSQGIVCPPSYTSPSQLPCPNEVIHRVEERVAAATGTPVFPVAGVIGLQGILIRNRAQVFGNVSTNAQLALQNSAQANTSANLVTAAPNPIIQNTALLGVGLVCNSGTVVWPSACVTRVSSPFTLLNNPPPYPENTDDSRVTNGLLPCALSNTCPHDTFSNSGGPCTTLVNSPCATWDATHRLLSLPNGVTWTISGGTYNFCSFTMSGSSFSTLANGVKAAIFIDSPSNPSPSPVSGSCQSGTGNMSVGNQSAFINNSPPLPGSPLAHDTTALQLWFYGPSAMSSSVVDWNNNSCHIAGSNTTDGTCIALGQGTDFYGTLYAPTSDINLANTGNTYGGVAGRTVTYDNPAQFTQDVNDPSLVTTATLAIYFRSAWTECNAQPTVASDPMSGC